MVRPNSVAGGRIITVCVRVSKAEAEELDKMRGGLSRSDYLREKAFEERQ